MGLSAKHIQVKLANADQPGFSRTSEVDLRASGHVGQVLSDSEAGEKSE